MNFAHDSLKLKSKAQNEDFCFDIETAQGHFFAVLDFAPHDYANLNATLKGKLETVVGSFASVSKFSPDLFLGFVAKEINNFLHHLGEQSSGPEILCSAGLCIVGGNRLSYLLCGNVRIDITGGRLLSLSGAIPEVGDTPTDSETQGKARTNTEELAQLGIEKLESPLTERVEAFTLLDDDVVLVMTHGLEAGFDRRQLPRELVGGGSPDPKSICEALMKASASSSDDRTVVVIAGPYEQDLNPALSDLGKTIALLEAKVNALAGNDSTRAASARASERDLGADQRERNVAEQLEALKVELAAKATSTDLVGFQGQLKTMTDLLGGKADSADVLALRQDVLKLSKVTGTNNPQVGTNEAPESIERLRKAWMGWPLLLVLISAVAAGFLGSWIQSRMVRKTPEAWTVRTSGNQIVIKRLDGNGAEASRTVNLNVAEPLKSQGEQTFSSFADVSQYIEKLSTPVPASLPAQASQTAPNESSEAFTEITVKPGDSLRKFAERYQVSQERIKELNPTVTRWATIRSGQRIKVPSPSSAPETPTPSPSPDQVAAQPAPVGPSGTIEVTVGPGDSLNRFAQRYNCNPRKTPRAEPTNYKLGPNPHWAEIVGSISTRVVSISQRSTARAAYRWVNSSEMAFVEVVCRSR